MSIVKCHKERLYPEQDPVCIHWTFGLGGNGHSARNYINPCPLGARQQFGELRHVRHVKNGDAT